MTIPQPTEADAVTVHIDAPPAVVWAIITDIAGMGRLSPECTGGSWKGGATGPAVGAVFKGTNKRGFVRWSTRNTVVAAEPEREFAFQTAQSGTEWRYTLTPDGDGTSVTESRRAFAPTPLIARIFTGALLGGGEGHLDELRAGMAESLDRLKAVAEAAAR